MSSPAEDSDPDFMEVSALKYSGGIGLHGRSPLLRLQSDERLVSLVRRGNSHAFEVLVSRYESRLLAFCRHMLGSREDAEDVLQEVMAAAFNAMLADERTINVRPWLYRIARNRSLNHLRRITALGVDSMDVHFSEHGASTADKVHEREEFKLLVGDIHDLPETQKTALVLREMDALSYEQIAEAMETTVPSVKSLLVRARVSLAEAAEARALSCEDVRLELGEVAEGLRRKPGPPVRRHLRNCDRCATFNAQLKETNKALAALLPLGPLALLRKFAFTHLSHSAGSGAAASGSTAAGTAAAGSTVMAGSTAGGFISAGIGAIATKAAAGLAAAALVTAGAVDLEHTGAAHATHHHSLYALDSQAPAPAPAAEHHHSHHAADSAAAGSAQQHKKQAANKAAGKNATPPTTTTNASTTPTPPPKQAAKQQAPQQPPPQQPGRTQVQSDPTVLSPSNTTAPTTTTSTTTTPTSDAPPSDTTTTPAPSSDQSKP